MMPQKFNYSTQPAQKLLKLSALYSINIFNLYYKWPIVLKAPSKFCQIEVKLNIDKKTML